MATQTSQQMEDMHTMWKTAVLDLPAAATKWGWGMSEEKEMTEAAWKGYDAWVRWASHSLNDLYRDPVFGELMARTLDRWLRWQRLGNAMAGAFFGGLWPVIGLPTAAAVEALQEELRAMDARLRSLDATAQSIRAELHTAKTEQLSAQDSTRRPSAAQAEQMEAFPAYSNGNGHSLDMTPALRHHKSMNGRVVKPRRKAHDIAA